MKDRPTHPMGKKGQGHESPEGVCRINRRIDLEGALEQEAAVRPLDRAAWGLLAWGRMTRG